MAPHPLFTRYAGLYRAGRMAEALEVLEQLEAARPGAPELAWHRACCLDALGRGEEAVEQLDRVLQAVPDYVPARVMRARIGLAQGRADDAEGELRRVLEAEPEHVEARVLLARCRARPEAGRAGLVDALRLLDEAMELAPPAVERLELRIAVLLRLARADAGVDEEARRGWLERALGDLDRCLARSASAEHALRMAMILLSLGRAEEAGLRCQQVLDLAGEDASLAARARALAQRARQQDRHKAAAPQAGTAAADPSAALREVVVRPGDGALVRPRAGVAGEEAACLVELAHARMPHPSWWFLRWVERQLCALGLDVLGDAAFMAAGAEGVEAMELRLFADDAGEVAVVAAGPLPVAEDGWKGRWRRLRAWWAREGVVECLSQFADGTVLTTRNAAPWPFGELLSGQLEVLPEGVTPGEVVARHLERHAAYKASHAGVDALAAHDVEGLDVRWQARRPGFPARKGGAGLDAPASAASGAGGAADAADREAVTAPRQAA